MIDQVKIQMTFECIIELIQTSYEWYEKDIKDISSKLNAEEQIDLLDNFAINHYGPFFSREQIINFLYLDKL